MLTFAFSGTAPIFGQPAAASRATGVVYEDRNANQRRDAGEPGLENVRVSNGREVVATDADGAYTLPVGENTILFVIKPRGYDTARDAKLKLPRFYYHHRPAGTPDGDFLFKGVGPTGPLPASVDFPLYPKAEAEKFSVVMMGDPQAYDTQELIWYARDMAPQLARVDAAFAVALGDLVGDNLNLFDPYNQVNATTPFPWYNVLGNHDLNYMAPTDEDSDATFERVYGPSTYAFQHGKVHFLILNNVYWPGFHGLRKDGWPKRGDYEGRLRPDQMTFVENYVKGVPADEAIVLCSHIPMATPYGDEKGQLTPQFNEVLRLLSGHPYSLSFSGHTHINFNLLAGSESGYRPSQGTRHLHHNVGTASGTWYKGPVDERGMPVATMRDGTPPGFAVVDFDGVDYRITFHPFRQPADRQMLIHLRDVVEASPAKPVTVQANVYNATDESTVRMRVDGKGDWVAMQPQRLIDPQYAENYERRLAEIAAMPDAKLPKLNEPMATDHQYVAPLPTLSEGTHLVEVETTDRYGRTFREARPVQVVSSLGAWQQLDDHNIRVPRPRKDGAGGAAAADAGE